MSEVLKTIRDFMEKEGIPGRDADELHPLNKTEQNARPGAGVRISSGEKSRSSRLS
jgi:hypothetical protein